MKNAWFVIMVLSLALLTACGGSPAETPPEDENAPMVLIGQQQVVLEGFDWGPGVTKTILLLDREVLADSVTPESFRVFETKESFDYAAYGAWAGGDESVDPGLHTTVTAQRTVADAYVCDETGAKVEGAVSGSAVALELACDPDSGNPYCFDLLTWHNTVCDPYQLAVTLTEDSTLKAAEGETPVEALEIAPDLDLKVHYDAWETGRPSLLPQFTMPQLEQVNLYDAFAGSDGRTLRYAYYAPMVEPDSLHPLVIWIHGAGEGGEDPTIPLLGNKVTALFGDAFQSVMGGAYVLVPQTPDFWLTYNENGDWQDNPGVSSVYNATLMELIRSFIDTHPGVDEDRIYIGGCSNGGFMTMDMVLTYPDFFAAAYPICEAYRDSGITDEQLQGIRDLPIWFIWAANDDTVVPETFEIPTVDRLRAIGANVHTSVFPNVVDTSGLYKNEDGTPYEYMGHWSWLYFFNGECEENGVLLWDWLAAQHK